MILLDTNWFNFFITLTTQNNEDKYSCGFWRKCDTR